MNDEYLKSLSERLKKDLTDIDLDTIDESKSEGIKSEVVEKQKVYFWIRLYIKEEDPNIEIGDDIVIKWLDSGEELETKFAAWGKKGLEVDHGDNIVNADLEDDKKILSLMVNIDDVNNNDDIPFIRTLFKLGNHYEDQLFKRKDLHFINKKNDVIIDYYDCDF